MKSPPTNTASGWIEERDSRTGPLSQQCKSERKAKVQGLSIEAETENEEIEIEIEKSFLIDIRLT